MLSVCNSKLVIKTISWACHTMLIKIRRQGGAGSHSSLRTEANMIVRMWHMRRRLKTMSLPARCHHALLFDESLQSRLPEGNDAMGAAIYSSIW